MALKYDTDKDIFAAETVTTPSTSTGYVAPTLETPNTQVGATKSAESYIDPETATVEGRVNNLVKEDGPLIQMARADALKTANNRNVLNSTMAATGGTRAAYEQAQSIAEPDAQTYAALGLQNQATDNTGLIAQQQAGLDETKAANNAALQGALSDQTFGQTQNTMELQNTIAESYKEFSNTFDVQLQQMGIDSAERIATLSSMASQTNTLMNNIGSLLNNVDIEMTKKTAGWMSDFMYSNWEGTGSLLDLDIKVA